MGQALPLNLCQRGRDEGITTIEAQDSAVTPSLAHILPLTSASGAGSWRGPSPARHRGQARLTRRPARREATRQALGVAGTPSA